MKQKWRERRNDVMTKRRAAGEEQRGGRIISQEDEEEEIDGGRRRKKAIEGRYQMMKVRRRVKTGDHRRHEGGGRSVGNGEGMAMVGGGINESGEDDRRRWANNGISRYKNQGK